ncbi:unnamed protein product [Pneumocystis jirovecii]|uniref:4-hydroxybenzoate polyprenyl transferase n=1 Tax=Pneumocystis jirovecii TaxID=42068 RepID=L0PIL7_PNEJI|nr:unnamed protein product [Pneumocystis jirovecii]
MAAYAQCVAPYETVRMLVLFGAGAVLMRGAGCTVNDWCDREIDARVARTALRPLAAGVLSSREASVFLMAQLAAAAVVLSQLNYSCAYMRYVGIYA